MNNLEWAGYKQTNLIWTEALSASRSGWLTSCWSQEPDRLSHSSTTYLPTTPLYSDWILFYQRTGRKVLHAWLENWYRVQYNFSRDLLFLLFISIFSNFDIFKWKVLVIVIILFFRKSFSLCRQGRWSQVILAVSWSWAVATCSSRKSADSSKPVSTDVPCAGICLKPQVVFFIIMHLKTIV